DLGDDRVLVADDAGEQVVAALQGGEEVVAQLVLDGFRLPAAVAELFERGGPGCGQRCLLGPGEAVSVFPHSRRAGRGGTNADGCKPPPPTRYRRMMNATSPPWSETAYRIDLPHPVPDDLPGPTAELFGWVWRTTLTEPGFALVRFSGPVGSRDLRRVLF